jgi:hypothetical protein
MSKVETVECCPQSPYFISTQHTVGIMESTDPYLSVESIECSPLSANVNWTPRTVGIMESTDQGFTNQLEKDCARKGGFVASVDCGKGSIQPMTKPRVISKQSRVQSDSSTDFSKALNFMDTCRRRPFCKEVDEEAFFKLISRREGNSHSRSMKPISMILMVDIILRGRTVVSGTHQCDYISSERISCL